MSVPQHRLDPKVSVVYIPDMNRQGDSNVTSPLSPVKAGVGTSSSMSQLIRVSRAGCHRHRFGGSFL